MDGCSTFSRVVESYSGLLMGTVRSVELQRDTVSSRRVRVRSGEFKERYSDLRGPQGVQESHREVQ